MTFPEEHIFAQHMANLGLRKTDEIVCYDDQGMAVVARAAWILNSYGVTNVKIMLGGLQGWMQAGNEV